MRYVFFRDEKRFDKNDAFEINGCLLAFDDSKKKQDGKLIRIKL